MEGPFHLSGGGYTFNNFKGLFATGVRIAKMGNLFSTDRRCMTLLLLALAQVHAYKWSRVQYRSHRVGVFGPCKMKL